jgi:hypothetical protein
MGSGRGAFQSRTACVSPARAGSIIASNGAAALARGANAIWWTAQSRRSPLQKGSMICRIAAFAQRVAGLLSTHVNPARLVPRSFAGRQSSGFCSLRECAARGRYRRKGSNDSPVRLELIFERSMPIAELSRELSYNRLIWWDPGPDGPYGPHVPWEVQRQIATISLEARAQTQACEEVLRRNRDDSTCAARSDRARNRRVLIQRQVSPRSGVVRSIEIHDSLQSPRAEHDDVIEALATDRSDKSLRVGVLPRGVRRCEHFANAHRLRDRLQAFECLIAISDEIPRGRARHRPTLPAAAST